MSPALHIEDITLRYRGAKSASLDSISFTLPKGEILSLVGESGSGKSSLLRVIAGFEKPQTGNVFLHGHEITSSKHFVRPEKRGIGFVSQGGDLFPHLKVSENITYGLKGHSKAQKQDICRQLLEAIELKESAKKYPHELSGGEQQRVALARALAPQPKLLLLDEPFSSLDSRLRKQLVESTFQLLKEQKTTALFVTHHAQDALKASDRIGVLKSGKCVQFDTPKQIWNQPVSLDVANLFSSNNDYQKIPQEIRARYNLPEWGKVSDISVSSLPDDVNSQNLLTGTVVSLEFLGDTSIATLHLEAYPTQVKSLVYKDMEIKVGSKVALIAP